MAWNWYGIGLELACCMLIFMLNTVISCLLKFAASFRGMVLGFPLLHQATQQLIYPESITITITISRWEFEHKSRKYWKGMILLPRKRIWRGVNVFKCMSYQIPPTRNHVRSRVRSIPTIFDSLIGESVARYLTLAAACPSLQPYKSQLALHCRVVLWITTRFCHAS